VLNSVHTKDNHECVDRICLRHAARGSKKPTEETKLQYLFKTFEDSDFLRHSDTTEISVTNMKQYAQGLTNTGLRKQDARGRTRRTAATVHAQA
jgi:hypothetical protein